MRRRAWPTPLLLYVGDRSQERRRSTTRQQMSLRGRVRLPFFLLVRFFFLFSAFDGANASACVAAAGAHPCQFVGGAGAEVTGGAAREGGVVAVSGVSPVSFSTRQKGQKWQPSTFAVAEKGETWKRSKSPIAVSVKGGRPPRRLMC